MSVEQFILQYFINPIFTGEGYNIYNTTVYVILLITSLYVVRALMKKLKITMNRELFNMLVPFVILGGALRALEDYWAAIGLAKNPLLITPGIYITLFVLTLVTVLAIRGISKKDFVNTSKKVGYGYLTLALLAVLYYTITAPASIVPQPVFFIEMIAATLFLTFVVAASLKVFKPKLFTKESLLMISGHMLDASASVIAIVFVPTINYVEQHVLSGYIMSVGTPFMFIPFKAVVVLLAIWSVKKYSEDDEWMWLLNLVILVVGMAPGTRDALRVLIGV